jgi:hypothetical protein
MNASKTLWIDDKTTEDIEYFSKEDSDNVIYNLQEDISCLKETIAELEGKISNATSNAKEVLADARNTLSVRRGFEMSGYVKHYIISREAFNSLKEKGDE